MPMRTLPGMRRPYFVDAIVVVAMFALVGFGLALFEWCGGRVTLALFGGAFALLGGGTGPIRGLGDPHSHWDRRSHPRSGRGVRGCRSRQLLKGSVCKEVLPGLHVRIPTPPSS
jgi:hypothetical protein